MIDDRTRYALVCFVMLKINLLGCLTILQIIGDIFFFQIFVFTDIDALHIVFDPGNFDGFSR